MAKLYVDDVSVGVKELCAVLGIDPKVIPSKLERIFHINPDRVTKDLEGNEKTPRRLGISTKFNVFSKVTDKIVTVRYAVTTLQDNKNGYPLTRYSPPQLWINGKEESIKEDLVHFFMYIHPDCKESPFRNLSSRFRYFFLDKEGIANHDLERDEQEMKAMSMILGDKALPITQLRQIAKGMLIPGVERLTDAEVKNILKKKAKEDPMKFRDDASSNTIVFNGVLQDAVDKNICKIVSNNGYKRWYFINQEIAVIPTGADEMNILKDAIIRQMDLIPQIMSAMEGISVASELNKPENQQYFKQFEAATDVTNMEISSNLKAENKDLDAEIALQKDIELLAEQEEIEMRGGEKIHHQRKPKLEKYRAEIDTYKQSEEFCKKFPPIGVPA